MTPNRVESGEIFQTAYSFFILFPSVINAKYASNDIVPVHANFTKITTRFSLSCGQNFNFKQLRPWKSQNPTYGSQVTAISHKIKCTPPCHDESKQFSCGGWFRLTQMLFKVKILLALHDKSQIHETIAVSHYR